MKRCTIELGVREYQEPEKEWGLGMVWGEATAYHYRNFECAACQVWQGFFHIWTALAST